MNFQLYSQSILRAVPANEYSLYCIGLTEIVMCFNNRNKHIIDNGDENYLVIVDLDECNTEVEIKVCNIPYTSY